MMRLAFVILGLAFVHGCAGPQPSTLHEAVVGGQASTADPAVGLLFSSKHACTASVISPHVLLTAGHCVDYTDSGIDQFHFYLGADVVGDPAPTLYSVVDRMAGPYYLSDQTSSGYDVGVYITQDELPVAPLPLRRTPITASFVGQQARLVGFGQTSAADPESKGIKREVTLTATSFDGFAVVFDDPAHGVCAGDSGGPTFVTTNGEEQIAAVVARGDADCALWSAAATFDSEVLAFIDAAIATHDPSADLGTASDAGSGEVATGGCSAARAPQRPPGAAMATVLVALWLVMRRRPNHEPARPKQS